MKRILFFSDDFLLVMSGFNYEITKENLQNGTDDIDLKDISDEEDGYILHILKTDDATPILNIEVVVEDGEHDREGGYWAGDNNIQVDLQSLRSFEKMVMNKLAANSSPLSKDKKFSRELKRMIIFMFHDVNIYNL